MKCLRQPEFYPSLRLHGALVMPRRARLFAGASLSGAKRRCLSQGALRRRKGLARARGARERCGETCTLQPDGRLAKLGTSITSTTSLPRAPAPAPRSPPVGGVNHCLTVVYVLQWFDVHGQIRRCDWLIITRTCILLIYIGYIQNNEFLDQSQRFTCSRTSNHGFSSFLRIVEEAESVKSPAPPPVQSQTYRRDRDALPCPRAAGFPSEPEIPHLPPPPAEREPQHQRARESEGAAHGARHHEAKSKLPRRSGLTVYRFGSLTRAYWCPRGKRSPRTKRGQAVATAPALYLHYVATRGG